MATCISAPQPSGLTLTRRVLCVDDDPNLLEGLSRQLRRQFEIDTALGGAAGLQAIADRGSYAVVMTDMRMPVMDGVQFLKEVRKVSPDAVRILLTGQANLDDAIAAVNDGHIFRFLTKPSPPHALSQAIHAALDQYQLVMAERELLQGTLNGSVKLLVELLSFVNPAAFSRANRIQRYVRHLGEQSGYTAMWELELAAMLSQIGCMALPQRLLEKVYAGGEMAKDEAEMFASHPALAYRLLANIPRLDKIAAIIEKQNLAFRDCSGSDDISLAAQMLRIAIDFDLHLTRGNTPKEAADRMAAKKEQYHPGLLPGLEKAPVASIETAARMLKVHDLATGMIANDDVRACNGLLLIAKGQEITDSALTCIRSFKSTVGIVEPLPMLVPVKAVPHLTTSWG